MDFVSNPPAVTIDDGKELLIVLPA